MRRKVKTIISEIKDQGFIEEFNNPWICG